MRCMVVVVVITVRCVVVMCLMLVAGDSEFDSPEPSKFVSSPKPEKSCPFVRQPPDGCEKVKAIEEAR